MMFIALNVVRPKAKGIDCVFVPFSSVPFQDVLMAWAISQKKYVILIVGIVC